MNEEATRDKSAVCVSR